MAISRHSNNSWITFLALVAAPPSHPGRKCKAILSISLIARLASCINLKSLTLHPHFLRYGFPVSTDIHHPLF